MLKVEEALDILKSSVKPIGSETIFIDRGLGRTVSCDLVARVSSPPLAVSSMDGYAVHRADIKLPKERLTLVGESRAGKAFSGKLNAGETVRIFTGAPVPNDTDAIVIQENVVVQGKEVQIDKNAKSGDFIRPKGLDFLKGETLFKQGRVLSARDIGVLASMNLFSIKVARRPRVAIIANGDELVMPGEKVRAGQLVSSNSISVANYVRVFGGDPTMIGIASDNELSIRQLLKYASGFDLILTIGGASVGDYDLVRTVIEKNDWKLGFYKVAMRPGKPTFFGHFNNIPLLGLPGNPVSAGVVSVVFLSTLVNQLLGAIYSTTRIKVAELKGRLKKNGDRQDYIRGFVNFSVNGKITTSPIEKQDSAMMTNFANADCLILRPPLSPAIQSGDHVEILLLDGLQMKTFNF